MRRFSMLMIAFASVVCFGCGEKSPQIVKREGLSDVVNVPSEDAQMSAAILKSRETVQDFINALKNPSPNQSEFAVKVAIVDNDKTEHMWMNDLKIDGDQFTGTVNNEPLELTNVKLGDCRSVSKSEISDWMFVDSGILKGGYTIRAIRESMPAAQRDEFDSGLPFRLK